MLSGLLPAPKHSYHTFQEEGVPLPSAEKPIANNKLLPAYPKRKGFVPIDIDDFGDGGAYPELHIVQYPLNMGRPGQKSTSVVSVQVDESGKIRTDLIVKQGGNRNKVVQSQMSDIKEKVADEDKMALPTEKEIIATADKTRLALESLIGSSGSSSAVVNPNDAAEPSYIRYTPNPTAPGYTAAAKQRVIKMVEAQIDPLEPPKHKVTKAPRGPPSPPVPVLHSPPRKITVADQQAWKVPPCVSNWKNARGFIIPLDKRIVADGRSLQEVTINNKFALMSETLFIAERKAAEDLKIRNDLRKKMALREKEEREESLREMANRARLDRAGLRQPAAAEDDEEEEDTTTAAVLEQRRNRFTNKDGDDDHYGSGRSHYQPHADDNSDDEDDDDDRRSNADEFESEADKIQRQQRERVRLERRKEREREIRLENMKGNMRKNKVDRDEGRDISEKIALGMLKGGGGKLTGESMYDSRLFNQTAGMDAGFGNEDEYNTYSKPLFDREAAGSIYRPKQSADDMYGGGDADAQLKKLSDTSSRFRADKGFKGADGTAGSGGRDAPIQFEKSGRNTAAVSRKDDDDDDPRSSSSRRKRNEKEEDDPFDIRDIVNSSSNTSSRGNSNRSSRHDDDNNNRRDDSRYNNSSSSNKRSRRDDDNY